MERHAAITSIAVLLRQYLISLRERLLERIDFNHWDVAQSRELAIVDEALTRLGHFDGI